jgi:SagB-type dehydrogenase family enzyme
MNTENSSKDIGDKFQRETKYYPDKLPRHFMDWNNKPELYKSYENPIDVISLPEPDFNNEAKLMEVLGRRRSRRNYDVQKSLDLRVLSTLLWATQGATEKLDTAFGPLFLRTAPSAGALFPVESYLNIRLVDGLKPGIYHFRPHYFDLELLTQGDYSEEFSKAALNQKMVRSAQVTFVWTAVVERSKWKYLQRAYRYIYLDAGHIGQNLYLAAEALQLGCCTIGAIFDEEANKLIDDVDGVNETVVYMATVGILK